MGLDLLWREVTITLLSQLLELWPTRVLTILTPMVTIRGKFQNKVFNLCKSSFVFYIKQQKLLKFMVNHFTCSGKQFEQSKYILFCLSLLIIKVIRLPILLSTGSENTKVLQLKIYLDRVSHTQIYYKYQLQIATSDTEKLNPNNYHKLEISVQQSLSVFILY